ncbi:MAG TPA: UDP-N-acetylmuramoyl-L-alanyl-D-glutamate--2,6-diaminopimelate ligase [Candidatus Moranbacteria bacterium]|nr:MAG: UDP-N-acetylmuramyl-tripeptide synthetase [Parcubacteria group bacterium GW2011_GWC1_45_14]HAV11220.1 UDP-N-acetylmuramoyl-L-alanyl-D-glutamate--2,6-diaminopimelate ligase [Candidatus Moranbacteria bacterium]
MHYLKSLVPQWIKNIYHLFQAILANLIYGFPSKKLKVIGVTGTNGKTTTVQMIVRILEKSGKKVAMASTINFKLGEKEWINKTKYTTLSPFATQKFIAKAVQAGCEYLVLETSSHSLHQFRVWGVKYRTAVITNVTREHLDYHRTMEKYRKAKSKLFKITAKNKGVLIVNLDMENPQEFLNFEAEKICYSTHPAGSGAADLGCRKLVAEEIELGSHETRYRVGETSFLLHMPGKYNIENALAAAGVALSEGISLETSASALEEIKGVSGRMDRVANDKGIDVVIDYAVTPDSLEKLYFIIENMRKGEDSKVVAVLGSCGERDRGKRPLMGKIVSEHADFVIITNEDPYFEDPQRIIDEVFAGVVRGAEYDYASSLDAEDVEKLAKLKKIAPKIEGENCWKIMDRREAIRKALELAKAGDIVVVTGKGAEEVMAIGNERITWNDKQVILEELGKMS